VRSSVRSPRLLGALLLASLAVPAHAARTALRHYTAADGLPQAQVTALVQDAQGYVWAGTLAGGLARYNGHRWDLFGTASGLPSESVTCLAAAGDGSVYVGTTNGLARFARGQWSRVPLPDPHRATAITSVLPAPGGRVWIGTSQGLFAAVAAGSAEAAYPADPRARVPIISLASDAAGNVWVGSREGLLRISAADGTLSPVGGLPAGRVWHVAVPVPEMPVVSIPDVGVYRREEKGWVRLGDDRTPGRRVYVLLPDAEDPRAVWMGTEDAGAFLARGAQVDAFGRAEGLPDLHVNALMQDREGQVWFGTDSGIVKRGPSAFLTWTEADGFPRDVTVFGMAEDAQGTLWMTAFDDGLIRRTPDGVVRRYGVEDGLPAPRVLDVAADPRGGVWASTRKGLVKVVDGNVTRPSLPDGAPRTVYAIRVLADGSLLLAGDGGLARVRGDKRELLATADAVSSIDVAPDGTIWYGAPGLGAGSIKDGVPGETITAASGLPSDQVTSVRADAAGGLWVATERGVWHRAPDGKARVIDASGGLPDNYVYWTGEDLAGGLWMGTNRGAWHRPRDGAPTVYTMRDGLGSDECNDDGFFVDRRGTVHIATVGVSVFTGPARPHRAVDPPVVIEGFVVGGREEAGGQVLPPSPGPVSVRFAGLTFTDENATRFRYRLRGLSDDWSETRAGQRETTYGGLGAGEYVFEVAAVTPDGRVSARPASVAFRVRPHWWRTPAAGVVAGLILLVGLLGFVRLRERRLVAAHLRLERIVADRTDELRRANERLEELAVTDELTGISNRRRLTEGLAAAIALARRQKSPLAVVLADLDRFKELNDTQGHEAGDKALVQAAQALQSGLREVDLLGRWGGEEFLAVLPGSDVDGAREVGERLRKAIEQMGLTNDVTGRVLTTSVGIAALADDVASPADLVRRADQALYAAKAAGRNRVEAWKG
jgi:diguanylate cyclase (GGDEF)-like protein